MRNLRFKSIAVLQLLLVVVAFVSWWIYKTEIYLHTPIGPHDEYYPHNWGFQSVVGGLYLVGLLALTAFVIILERWICDLVGPRPRCQ
jgi:hypothetical protein